MNQKIENLKNQCYISLIDRDGDMEYDMEKFAELIVRECQLRVEQYINDCGEVSSIPDTVIMKHFGVE